MLRPTLFALFVSAAAACSSAEPDWQYTSADVESALVGTWTGTWTAGGKSGSMELVLARTTPTATPKCGNRTLSGPLSPKCIDSSSLELTGTLTTSDATFTKTSMHGSVMVDGLVFSNGRVALFDAANTMLTADYRSATLVDGRVKLSAGDATFTLTRATR